MDSSSSSSNSNSNSNSSSNSSSNSNSSSKNKNKEKRAMVAEIMYDYDAVKRVLNVKELSLPLIFRKDYFSESDAATTGGIGRRGAHSCVRVFIAESDLRSSSAVLDRMSWRDFSVLYTDALRALNNSRCVRD